MPACPACGVAMTSDEWSTGSCFACRAPLLEQKRYDEPASAFDPTSPSSVKIDDHHRPAWGTVRTGLLLQIAGVLLLWLAAAGIASLDVSFHPMRRPSPSEALFASVSIMGGSIAVFCLFAGYLLCAAVPSVERVRRWMWASLFFTVSAFATFGCFAQMVGTNTVEENLQAKRESYLRKLDLRTAEDPDAWKDSLWSENTMLAILYGFWGAVLFGVTTYVLFIWSLAGFFRRRRLRHVFLGLSTAFIVIVSLLQALSSFESLAPADVTRGLQETTAEQAGYAILFIGMLILTIYAGCCWTLRNDIATLLRGERLR